MLGSLLAVGDWGGAVYNRTPVGKLRSDPFDRVFPFSSPLTAVMSREEDIYEEHVLDHYEDPYHRGHLDHKTHQHEGDNPLCGDVVHVELKLDDEGNVKEAWFEGEGCVISQASASMLMEKIEGMSRDQSSNSQPMRCCNCLGQADSESPKMLLIVVAVVQTALHSPVESP